MKHTKLFGCLLTLAMLLMAGADAMAQELTLKTVTFLTPGQKATIAVGLDNDVTVDALQGRIALPEGLTFVEKANNAKRFNINKTERTQGMSLLMQKVDERTAVFVGISSQIAAGKGDVFTFDVNVAPDYSGAADITLSGVQLGIVGQPYHEGTDVTAKIASTDDQVTVSGAAVAAAEANTYTVTLNLAFDKKLMRGAALNLVLPEGLTVVDGSAKVGTELCPNHKANIKGKVLTVNVLDYFEDDTFAATEGEMCSFNVVADETFVAGSEILFQNVRSWAQGGSTTYYAEDFAVKVGGNATGINGISADQLGADGIYTISGVRTDQLQKGINIVVKNGKAVKVVKK